MWADFTVYLMLFLIPLRLASYKKGVWRSAVSGQFITNSKALLLVIVGFLALYSIKSMLYDIILSIYNSNFVGGLIIMMIIILLLFF